MSKLIKTLSLLLMLVFVFAACQTAADETVPEYDACFSDETDLDGFEVLWGWDGFSGESGLSGETFMGYVTGTENADLLLARIKDVEKGLNCKITVDNNHTIMDTMRYGVVTGQKTYDVITGNSYFMVNDVRAGYYQGLSTLLDLSDTEKWGTPGMLQSVTWENDTFGVVPFAWPDLTYLSGGYVIVVNESIVSKLSQPDPRDYVENNAWTWDQFEDCLTAYTHEDSGKKVYGIKIHESTFSVSMMLSNGVPFTAVEDGQVVCGAYTQAGYEALSRAKKMYYETHHDCFHPAMAALHAEDFYNDECVMYGAFTLELMANSSHIMYQKDNVGILPYPQGPHATPGEYHTYYEGFFNTTSIPFNAKDPNATAQIIAAVYEPFDEYKTKEDIIDYMTRQVFYDKRDAEILVNVTRNTEYGFFLEGALSLFESIINSPNPVSQQLESNRRTYDRIVEKYILPHYEGKVAVYGE